ncbi:MAG: hypothetical protein ACOC9Y_05025 [Chloroflexota bacterium]
MSGTTTSAFYVDPVLTNLSIAYQPQAFIADRLFPRLSGLTKPSGVYYKFGKEHFGPVPETLRAPGTRAREVEWQTEKATFTTAQHSLIGKVPDEDREAQDAPVQLEQTTTLNTTELVMLDREIRVKDLLTDDSGYDSDHTRDLSDTATDQWSDNDDSTPVQDVVEAKSQLRSIGVRPNTMVIPSDVMDALQTNQDILDRIKYTQTGLVTREILQTLFGIPNILVPDSVYNSANAGQDADLTDLWTDFVWLGFVAPRPALRVLTFGLTFEYRGRQVRRWREEDKRSDFFEVWEEVGEEIISYDAGYLFTDVLA